MRQRGFTLIEIMVVVVILGLLATLVLPRVIGRQEEAFVVKAKSDISALSAALKLYKLDNFSYPTTEQGLEALVKEPDIDPVPRNWKKGGYIERLPADPWGSPYRYRVLGGDRYELVSNGPDGQEGTGDDLAWQHGR